MKTTVMNRIYASIGLAILAGGLAACGGGGGGGGSFLPPAQTPAQTPTTPSMTVAVMVNGGAAQSSNGHYAVKPTDRISVTTSQAVNWTVTATPPDTAAPRNASQTSLSWSGQVANLSASSATLVLNASADASHTQDVAFDIAPGNAGNGSYQGFAANGSRPVLALDFDNMAYVMTDENGVAVTDALVADPTDSSSFLFKTSRVSTAAAASRFRISGDTVVGSFPFHAPKVLTSFAVRPFVASRALVATQSQLDGSFTRLGIQWTETSGDSDIRQWTISGGGTLIQYCNLSAITSVATCPLASIVNYSVSAGPSPVLWKLQNQTNAEDWGYFAIARVAGKNVYLSAGSMPTAPNSAIFRIGLLEGPSWPALSYIGGDISGSWGSMNYTATTYDTLMARTDTSLYGYTASLIGPGSFLNLRSFTTSGTNYFTAQDGTLGVVVGARSGPAAGNIQIGLVR